MIRDLDGLIEYSERMAGLHPVIADRLLITKPGISSKERRGLREVLPRIPEEYVSVVSEIDINGIALGFFELAPPLVPSRGLVEKLKVANDPHRMPFVRHCLDDGTYHIASREADPVCIAFSNTIFSVGQMVMYSIEAPDRRARILGNGFKQFLFTAATADEIAERLSGNVRKGLVELEAYFQNVGVDSQGELAKSWFEIVEQTLG